MESDSLHEDLWSPFPPQPPCVWHLLRSARRPRLLARLQVALSDMSINGKPVTATTKAILDTGTSLLTLPTADAKAFMASIGASPFLNGECASPSLWRCICAIARARTPCTHPHHHIMRGPVNLHTQGISTFLSHCAIWSAASSGCPPSSLLQASTRSTAPRCPLCPLCPSPSAAPPSP